MVTFLSQNKFSKVILLVNLMQARKSIFIAVIFTAIFNLFISELKAASSQNFHDNNSASEVKVVGSYYLDNNSVNRLILGFSFKIAEGWKIYGNDDSGFGQPPRFDFKGSTNIDIKKFNIIWPDPIKEQESVGDELINFSIYKKDVVIPVEMEAIDVNSPTNLIINLSYALCKDVCIPVSQSINLEIPALHNDPESLHLVQKYLDKKIVISDSNIEETTEPSAKKIPMNLSYILLVAFIGGLILNIMPCVLPVLSIKLLSIINHTESSTSRIRLAYASTIVGIVTSFLIFAAITATLKFFGNSFGWGLQFQNPYFLIFLIVVLTLFSAILLDEFVLNIGSNLISFLNNKISSLEEPPVADIVDADGISYDLSAYHNKSKIIISNFLSGILAVLLATPCSAPFLGTAISFALSQNALQIFLIFTFMSLGLAFPYFILIAFPGLSLLFPRPGNWMNVVKRVMAGFLLATVIWLIYILTDNIGVLAAYLIAFLAVFILMVLKINLSNKTKIIFLAIVVLSMFVIPSKLMDLSKIHEKEYDELWVKFDLSKVNELVADDKVVVIDITADWCITCKLNKSLVLESGEVVAKLKSTDIVAMRGDLTKPDEEILNFMRSHNRYGIPFNIVYGPSAKNGILVSELLDKSSLIEAIKKAK